MYFQKCYDAPLGEMIMVSDGTTLTSLVFKRQKYYESEVPEDSIKKSLPIFDETARWLDIYFSGIEPDFTPAISLKGSEFRKEVWDILMGIPYGEVTTYGEIAKQIAKKRGISRMSAQAVGGAVGHNPISIIVPCHRVVGANGNLTGYAGGLEKKVELLRLEGIIYNMNN
ncbi:MAG: methylated-DNA--[protein]-cysteine S-methyltransferase [Lachnospiraceae bacterium]|nr:methylated-DNA--[protein]-cysteine S-methyltransferase [Lachnospiraceae bacterium]